LSDFSEDFVSYDLAGIRRLALAGPAQADPSGRPVGLAMHPTGGGGSAKQKLLGLKHAVGAGAAVLVADARVPSKRVTCRLTEACAQVAAGGEEGPEVVETDPGLRAVAVPVRVTDT